MAPSPPPAVLAASGCDFFLLPMRQAWALPHHAASSSVMSHLPQNTAGASFPLEEAPRGWQRPRPLGGGRGEREGAPSAAGPGALEQSQWPGARPSWEPEPGTAAQGLAWELLPAVHGRQVRLRGCGPGCLLETPKGRSPPCCRQRMETEEERKSAHLERNSSPSECQKCSKKHLGLFFSILLVISSMGAGRAFSSARLPPAQTPPCPRPRHPGRGRLWHGGVGRVTSTSGQVPDSHHGSCPPPRVGCELRWHQPMGHRVNGLFPQHPGLSSRAQRC